MPCKDSKQNEAEKLRTIPDRRTSGNCKINTQSFQGVGDSAGRSRDGCSEGSVVSWSVSSDQGCPAKDVAPPSAEDKHEQLLAHRQADTKGDGEGREESCEFCNNNA